MFPVLLLDEDAIKKEGRRLEGLIAVLLGRAAAAGAAMVDLDPRHSPTTHFFSREMELIEEVVPELPPELVVACQTELYGNGARITIGTETSLDIDEIDFHQVDGEPMVFAPYLPILGVGEAWNRSYWNPATDGVGLQFFRAERSKKLRRDP